ncbi:hypothetical protein FISHEDRAFT_49051 [Fistulina hepatica ATCC 64428]|uniref:Uncharacterized protein n=1 Tax=Fistulina hepatica ATCC 64428 TaxID=1128425 RepID=A0A0D7A435_9AGAR|nr:hypothetical protein FISHEDRAFT_49051 [Fistulina hepatica ATCC 64428]
MQTFTAAAPGTQTISSSKHTHVLSAPSTPVNDSSPQCCHCGWRGEHAPDCPFR